MICLHIYTRSLNTLKGVFPGNLSYKMVKKKKSIKKKKMQHAHVNICVVLNVNVQIICHLCILTLKRLCDFGCSPLSESASTVGAGFAAPALQSGHVPMAEVFRLAVSSFKINDWNLFGSGP